MRLGMIFVVAAAVSALAGCGSGNAGNAASSTVGGPSGGGVAGTSPGVTTGSSAVSSASTRVTAPATGTTGGTVPHYAHIVVVVEENHGANQVIGSSQAPYMNSLASTGVPLTQSFGISHPSEPNYLALFSGSTHGITDDSCPHTFSGTNLGQQLRASGQTFTGYAESLPAAGSNVCTSGSYARKHAPWTDFSDLPGAVDQPLSAFPADYARLPRVAFVVPNLDHDMHDGTVAQADSWLKAHLSGYVSWARNHNSLFILTWDEDDNTSVNHIPGVLAGAHLKTGPYSGRVDHYTMLRTIESACNLGGIGTAAQRAPIAGIWD